MQNTVASTQMWNEDSAEINSVEELLCVTLVKHRKPHTSRTQDEYDQHRVACYDYVPPKVVFTQPMEEDLSAHGPDSGKKRGRRGSAGLTRSYPKKIPAPK
jgi:hypothetical protein